MKLDEIAVSFVTVDCDFEGLESDQAMVLKLVLKGELQSVAILECMVMWVMDLLMVDFVVFDSLRTQLDAFVVIFYLFKLLLHLGQFFSQKLFNKTVFVCLLVHLCSLMPNISDGSEIDRLGGE